jgi:PTH1 family peptidyl-tRNA hydrolase
MYCVVGLGNPDIEYQRNRHNIGFMVADEIIRRFSVGSMVKKHSADIVECKIGDIKFFTLKPMTYMNRSGISVAGLMTFYKILPQNVIVIHDDLDLIPFEIRVKQAGGHGGHNGLKSIDSMIGKNYTRIRIGIGRPADKEQVTSWVLGDFKKTDNETISHISDRIALKLEHYFTDGLTAFKEALQGKY